MELRVERRHYSEVIVHQTTRQFAAEVETIIERSPSIRKDHLRYIDDGDAPVLLVGVVHDHPASEHRVGAVIEATDPTTVGVELPNVMVPVFEPEHVPDGVGGEMATAIETAGKRIVVGIDIPGSGTGRTFLSELWDQRVAPATVLETVRSIAGITTHALLGRLSQIGIPGFPSLADLENHSEYDLPTDATIEDQAEHEATHLHRSATMRRVFDPPASTTFLDAIRDRYMAARLNSLRRDGPVVAVVGWGHLDGIEANLQA